MQQIHYFDSYIYIEKMSDFQMKNMIKVCTKKAQSESTCQAHEDVSTITNHTSNRSTSIDNLCDHNESSKLSLFLNSIEHLRDDLTFKNQLTVILNDINQIKNSISQK